MFKSVEKFNSLWDVMFIQCASFGRKNPQHLQCETATNWDFVYEFVCFFCISLRLTVCKMTVSLSSAESHLGLNFPVVLHGLLPPWSVSGVGVQLFHQHDKWFRKLPHCSLTNRKHTRMLSTSIFHPVVCICLHLWFRPRGHGMHEGGGGQNRKRLGTGVERKSDFGLDCLSVCRD